jgi:hypothetical protein
MPRTRRRLLRTLGATTVGVAVAGCPDGDDGPSDSPTPTDTATPTATDTATPTETYGAVVVAAVTVQPQLATFNSPDSYGIYWPRDTQWVVAEVAAADGPPPASFALETPTTDFEMTTDVGHDRGRMAGFGPAYGEADAGWLATEVPNPLEAEEAALTWDGGRHVLDAGKVDRLRKPPTTFEVSFEAAPIDSVEGAARSTVVVENLGNVTGTFVGAINMQLPAYVPEARIVRTLVNGKTEVASFAHRWRRGSRDDGYDEMKLELIWRGGEIGRTVDLQLD